MLDFGKYNGLTLAEVKEIDVSYITWLEVNKVSKARFGLGEALELHAASDGSTVTRRQMVAAAGKCPMTWGKFAGKLVLFLWSS